MSKSVTRRDAIKGAATVGGVLLSQGIGLSQESALEANELPVEVSLTSVSAETVRITVQPVENGQAQPIPNDGALVKENWGQPAARLRTVSGTQSVQCGDLTVKVSGSPLTIRVEAKGGRLVQELKNDPATGYFSFQIDNSPVLGMGQGGPQFDRRGSEDEMRSGQGGYQLATHGARVPIQFAIGTSGWAMFIHHPLGSFDFRGEQGQFMPAKPRRRRRNNEDEVAEETPATTLPLEMFVTGSTDPRAVLREYAELVGYAELPPLWSFGYQQSHRTLGPPEEIVQEAKMFREKKLPCDMMIYLGTDFCPNGWNTHNGEFTWNEKAFPDPKGTIEQLHAENFKVALHIVVESRRVRGRVSDPCTAAPLPPGRTEDGRWPAERQVSCYWPAHKPLFDLGVDGWWPDQGDGLDGPSRLDRNRMYFEGSQMYRPNERVFALHRNGYTGMSRFASFLWSGDVRSLWETLENHLPIAVNTGLSGIPWWGTDIGGFVPTEEFTGELYVRWFQFAAFNPLFRSHGRDWRLRLPWGWNTGDAGFSETRGWTPDPAELRNPAIEPICKKYLELRYQMMPYLYSAVKETSETGLPVIRSLWLHYPNDSTAVARGDEYLYGRDLLVAPVVKKGATSRSLYLPQGSWYDFWTREKMQGGREITRTVDLETTPLYVRAGAIIPMGPVKQYTSEPVDGPLTLWVHPGADGTFALYEDDGTTFNFRKGEFMRVNMTWNDSERQLSLRLAGGSRMIAPAKREIVVRVAGESTSREAVFDGSPLDIKV